MKIYFYGILHYFGNHITGRLLHASCAFLQPLLILLALS